MTRSIKRILVPLDGSENSFNGLDEAIYLARRCGATITALCIVPEYPPIPLMGVKSSFREQMSKQAKKFMTKAKKMSENNGIVFNEKIISGIATLDIAEFANDKKFDLVVIGSRGYGSLKELFLGSVANSVVHKSKVPVLVVK